MAKLHIYLLALVVWILLFHFAGLIADTPSSYILNNLGVTNPENFGSTTFYLTFATLTLLGIGGVSIGILYGRGADIVLLTTTIAFSSIFLLILWDFIALFSQLVRTNHYIAVLLISPLMFIYALTIYEWVRGMST